jgi:hypothetical protein
MAKRNIRLLLLAGSCLAFAQPSLAKPAAAAAVSAQKRVYTLTDFARFAPKTAYDMLAQVPGFTIQTVDTSTRGLGHRLRASIGSRLSMRRHSESPD